MQCVEPTHLILLEHRSWENVVEAGETARCLRAFAALEEDPSSVLHICVGQLTSLCSSSSGAFSLLFCTNIHIPTHRHMSEN